jgi:hypothetical protein
MGIYYDVVCDKGHIRQISDKTKGRVR